MRIVSGSTTESIYFVAFSTADHVTRVTGHTTGGFSAYFSIANSTGSTHGVAFTQINSTQMPGLYSLTIADSTITTLPAGVDSRELAIVISGSMDTVTRTVELYRRTVTTGATLVVNSSGEPTNVMSGLSSIAAAVSSVASAVSSVSAAVSSVASAVSSVSAAVSSVATKTDSLTFTEAGVVDSNIQYVNDVQVQGTGSTADTWRPV